MITAVFKKEYKIRRMPNFASLLIDDIKLSVGFQSYKLLYTANLFLPLALLAEITFLPFFVFILALKPCVLFLGVLCGWYVLFMPITLSFYFDSLNSTYII